VVYGGGLIVFTFLLLAMNLLEHKNIILGSKSPRRVRLLREMGFEFRQESLDIDESFPSDLNPSEVAENIAKKKAEAFHQPKDNELIITADTIVLYGEKILGKPGVCIRSKDKEFSFTDSSMVKFSNISLDAINYYMRHQAPLDKAGSYGIQEWIGHNFIEKIEGSYTNIMGLPTEKLFRALQKFG